MEADTEAETNVAEAEVAEINAPSGEHPDPASLIPRNLAIDLVSDFENEELVGPTSRQPTIANPLPSSEDIESSNQAPMSSCAAIPVYTKGNFEEVYVASIQRPLIMVENQFSQLQWSETDVQVNPPATEIEV